MKRLAFLSVLLLATPALAGSYWVEPFGGFSSYNMGILNDRIEGLNNAFGTGLGRIGSGSQFGLVLAHDMDRAPGAVGIIVESMGGKSSGAKTFRGFAGGDSVDYDIQAKVPAIALRGFLAGRLPSFLGDRVRSSLGWSFGLLRSTGKVTWTRTEHLAGNAVVTETTADMSGTSFMMDWYLNSVVRASERLAVAVDLGYRMAPTSKTVVTGTAIDGSYALEYRGLFARLGLVYRLTI